MKAVIEYLKITGMTQDQLAKKADIEPAQLNHFIKGRREPRIKNLRKLSNATGITLEKLLEGMSG